MKVALLDSNVLLALAWPNHQHHEAAHRWFHKESRHGWATCAATEISFVRLSSNPAYTRSSVTPVEAAALLRRWTEHRDHRFWKSSPADDPAIFRNAFGHQQVMDAWLVRAAFENDGRLITFDGALLAHAKAGGLVELLRG